MKNPMTPGKSVRLRLWSDFALLARDARNFSTTVVEVETAQDHAALVKQLNDTPRPYAVCILRPK